MRDSICTVYDYAPLCRVFSSIRNGWWWFFPCCNFLLTSLPFRTINSVGLIGSPPYIFSLPSFGCFLSFLLAILANEFFMMIVNSFVSINSFMWENIFTSAEKHSFKWHIFARICIFLLCRHAHTYALWFYVFRLIQLVAAVASSMDPGCPMNALAHTTNKHRQNKDESGNEQVIDCTSPVLSEHAHFSFAVIIHNTSEHPRILTKSICARIIPFIKY